MESSFSSEANLGRGFSRYFQILPALDGASRDEVYTIRHEVYCEDLGYEPLRSDRHEVDEYDRHSLHCLLRTADAARAMVGCTRLVLARPEDPHHPFPFEVACAGTLDQHAVDSRKLPRHRIAEVSRLAISKNFRRRRGEKHTEVALKTRDFGSAAQPRFPFIPVSLYLGAMALSQWCGIEKVFVITEPRLAVHLAKLGFAMEEVGPPIEHRGIRVPSIIDVEASSMGLRSLVRPLWDVVRNEVMAGCEGRKPPVLVS